MEPLLFLSLIISFLVVVLLIPGWIKRAKKAGLQGKDLHKNSKEKIAESGGVITILGFLFGVLFYVALKTFYFKSTDNLIEIFAMLCVVLLVSFMGFIDDILGWKIGLTGKSRIILILVSTIPMVVINAGNSKMLFPFIGLIDIGFLYALFIVPIWILCASVAFNTIAGYNGIEAGQGILLLFGLALVTWFSGNSWLSLIALCMVTALFGQLIFNKIPAKVFPGNSITFGVGALFAIIAILGNVERFALFIFIPYILEVILKLRGNLKKQSYGKLNKDGSLDLPYEKFYGLEHAAIWFLKKIKNNVYEKDVIYFIHFTQGIIILVGLVFWKTSFFY